MSSLRVGNIYGHGFDAGGRARLEAAGFAFRPQVSTYAGSQLCTFIDFAEGPSLELIEVTDRADYEAFVPAGMEPYCPGVSLVVEGAAAAELDGYERGFPELEPYRLDVPYPDLADASAAGPAAPGWHYLNFGSPVLPGAFVWLTAFDQPRDVPVRRTAHPNGVRGIVAVVFDARTRLEHLSALAGVAVIEQALQLGDVRLLAVADGPPGAFPVRAVVLRADSLETFAPGARSAEATRLMGRTAVRIATNPLAWDLWVVD